MTKKLKPEDYVVRATIGLVILVFLFMIFSGPRKTNTSIPDQDDDGGMGFIIMPGPDGSLMPFPL